MSAPAAAAVPAVESISLSIASMRGQRVILDDDLAALYGVEIRRLNEQIKRNLDRFPTDFMFRLTTEEFDSLRSQFATLKTERGQHRKYLPYAFTEHGAIMAAMVLASPRAVELSVYVVRAFVRLREAALQDKDLAKRLDALEEKTESLAMQHDTFSPQHARPAPPGVRGAARNDRAVGTGKAADRVRAARGEEEQAGRQGCKQGDGSQEGLRSQAVISRAAAEVIAICGHLALPQLPDCRPVKPQGPGCRATDRGP